MFNTKHDGVSRLGRSWRQAMRIELTGRILPERPDRF